MRSQLLSSPPPRRRRLPTVSLGSGTSFLHYRLLEKIGEGGMGAVLPAGRTQAPLHLLPGWKGR